MADLKKRQAEKAAETPEQKAAREKLKAELAATVIGVRRESPRILSLLSVLSSSQPDAYGCIFPKELVPSFSRG
jgi:hypothetical protein